MLSLSPGPLVQALNALPVEAVEASMLLLAYFAALILLRLFGVAGLYVHIVLAIIAANLDVIKIVKFSVLPEPVALGTSVFASTYLATDLLAEHYGKAAARRGVMIGFMGYLLWTLMIVLTLGYRPLDAATAGDDLKYALDVQPALLTLFTPAPSLFAAGMISYLTSQLCDIWIFQRVRRATDGRYLWLRTNASTWISALIDSTVFSTLAWVVFAARPIGLGVLVGTYILGTYGLRLLYSALETPFMYLSRLMLPRPALANG